MVVIKKWFPAILMMLVIFGASSIPGKIISESGFDREAYQINAHFVLFIILCFTFFKATKNILVSIILTALYGAVDEFHQRFVPLRNSSILDMSVDMFGGLISGLILWKFQHILPKKLKDWLNK